MPYTESVKNLHRFTFWQHRVHLPGLSGLFLNTIFLTLCFSLFGLFLPMFVFLQTDSLVQTILFFTIWEAVNVLAIIPATWYISRVGPDYSILSSALLRGLYLILLILVPSHPNLLWVVPVLGGMSIPLHWIPYHCAFDKQANHKELGNEVGLVYILSQLSSALAPFVGGILALYSGFNALYLVALCFLVVSILPIFLDQYTKSYPFPGIKNIILGRKANGVSSFSLAFFGVGLESSTYSYLWPLFLFLTIGNAEKMGTIQSLSLIVSLVTAQVLRKKPLTQPTKLVSYATVVNSFNWAVKTLSLSAVFLGLSDLVYLFASVFLWLPFNSSTYYLAKANPLCFYADREIAIHSGSLVALLLSLLLLGLGLNLGATLLIGIIGLNLIFSWANQHAQN